MRRMSFSATIPQMLAGEKTVTRRDPFTWQKLRPGDNVLAVEKAMGLPKGAKQTPIGVIKIVSNEIVPFVNILLPYEAHLEGFESVEAFLDAWQSLHGKQTWAGTKVRRIEFIHVPDEPCDASMPRQSTGNELVICDKPAGHTTDLRQLGDESTRYHHDPIHGSWTEPSWW